ncbi:MAG: hypothetical protein CMJ78_18815 [Planctomycetaceae bacterium]|nr:hypothetical protein [Planctomycetaceae bacterium]
MPLLAVGQDASEGRKKETGAKRSMSLADFEGLAFQHNPTLARATARIQAAKGRQFQAGRYPNPVIGYHATEVGNRGTSGQQGGFVSQRFITAGKLKLDQEIASKAIDEAHFLFHGQEQRVLSDVRIRFYETLVAQRRVELTKELARIGDELVQATEKLLQGRLGTDNDLLQAEIRADESRILLDNARNEHQEAWRRLLAVVGKPRLKMVAVSGDLVGKIPKLDWDACYETVLSSNPQLNAAQARVDRASVVIRRARREPIPNVDFIVSMRHNNITGSDNANVQLGIPLPVFDRNKGNISAAEAEWIAAKKDAERIELHIQDHLATAYRRYANARQQVERYGTRMVPRAKKSLALVTGGYEKGQVQYLTLLTAQQTYLQVNMSYLESLREFRTSMALINAQLFSGSLK